MNEIYKWIILIAIIVGLYVMNVMTSQSKSSDSKQLIIQTLVRQAARWSVAAAQDASVMIAVLHANYGAGYLWALRDIATDSEIQAATGIDVLKFRDEITKVQDWATRRMIKTCESYAPTGSYLAKIAGES